MVDLHKAYLDVKDIMEVLGYKSAKVYHVIADLNAELVDQGYYIVEAKVPAEYFCKRYGIKQNIKAKPFLFKDDVKAITGFAEFRALEAIRKINNELKSAGILTCKSRVSTEHFCKRFNISVNSLPFKEVS